MLPSALERAASQLVRTADETPSSRERSIDLLRAVAIGLVVLGHWLALAVTETGNGIDGINALAELGWTHPVTWLFQVMPLFFIIGGYANRASLVSNRRDGGDAVGWLLGRLERLVWPSAVLLAVLAASVPLSGLAGVDGETASRAVWAASVPLWFLAAYVAVLLLAPLTEALHRRIDLRAVALFVAVIVAADVVRMAVGVDQVGYVNHLVVWLTFHQLGYTWRDGTLEASPRVGAALAVLGFGAAILLTSIGPYPISMVGVPGEDLQNTAPPTIALFGLGVGQLGIALAFHDPLERMARRRPVWLAVVAVNAVILTVFLWHLVAALLAALVLYASGLVPTVPVDSGAWLAWRLAWVPACAVMLVALVAIAGGVELAMPAVRKGQRVTGPARLTAVFGGVVVLSGLLGIAVAGDDQHGPLGLPSWALVSFALGAWLLFSTRSRLSEGP